MKERRVYLSLPIGGRDIEDVRKDIDTVSRIIREQGWTPVSPLDGVTDYNLPWIDYIIDDLKILSGCTHICFIGDCSSSAGCQIEEIAAHRMGLCTMNYDKRRDILYS